MSSSHRDILKTEIKPSSENPKLKQKKHFGTRIFPHGRSNMSQQNLTFSTLTENPSAYIPVAMSLIALVLVASAVISGDATPQPDEGTVAHLWQILIWGQIPIVVFFAIKWLRRSPKRALKILMLQVGGLLANFAVIFFLKLG
jgi:hypothetical protein